MSAVPVDEAPLVTLADLSEIELVMLKRMREVTLGDHRSRAHGAGFDFVGLRDWQAGDRPSAIDWPQSTMTNFSPLVVREFEQPSTGSVLAVADQSLSTRCGVDGVPIARTVAHAVATIGVSAGFFQDPFGILTFDRGFQCLGTVRPRTGRGHVVHCLDAYQHGRGLQPLAPASSISTTLAGHVRGTAMLPVISDFLFRDAADIVRELALLNAVHDVFLVLVDAAHAFELPPVSTGWIETIDVETGQTQTISRRGLTQMADRARRWQADVERAARDQDLDLVRIGPDHPTADIALGDFVAERRLRKTKN